VQRSTSQGSPDYKAFWLAALYWCAGGAIFYIAAWWLEKAVWQVVFCFPRMATTQTGAGFFFGIGPVLGAVLLGLALKPMLAWAMLKSEVLAVETALAESLPAGRERLSWLVSRDVTQLSAVQVRESAIESLAENLNDSVVAPIFWFVLLGLPGAVLYRFANTADAMWGYRGVYKGQNWEWAGKWAARADDLLSWLPARLTGVLLALVCRVSLRQLRAQSRLTPSPNSGWPMAAMALALGVSLGKPGVYRLNEVGSETQSSDVQRAIVCASKTLLVLVPIAWLAIYVVAIMKTGSP
jgi:adenosylcobinamide-phosphate synthase